jgi:hypothetical protein
MALKALRLIEVNNKKVNTLEFNSFKQLEDYVKSKSGKVSRPSSASVSSKPSEKKLLRSDLKKAVQEKKSEANDSK